MEGIIHYQVFIVKTHFITSMYEFSLHTRQANYTHYTFTSIFIDVCACINSLILVPLICGCIACVCACCVCACVYVCVHVRMCACSYGVCVCAYRLVW